MWRVVLFLSLVSSVLCQETQEFQREVENPQNCAKDQQSKNGDTIIVSYKGLLKTGKVFDSTEGKDPISYVLGENRVIKGWEKGLVDTCAGEKVVMIIPPELGYGRQGAGGVIPGNATLYFITTLEGIIRKGEVSSCEEAKTVKSGAQVTMTSRVSLASGKLVDSSTDSLKFPGGLPIKGWELGTDGACEGETREILLGPNLAWGETGLVDRGVELVPAKAPVVIKVTVDKVEQAKKDLVLNFLDQISSGTFNNGK